MDVNSTEFIYFEIDPENYPVNCFWNGSNETVQVVTETTSVIVKVTLTALRVGSGERYCNRTFTAADMGVTSNPVPVIVRK